MCAGGRVGASVWKEGREGDGKMEDGCGGRFGGIGGMGFAGITVQSRWLNGRGGVDRSG